MMSIKCPADIGYENTFNGEGCKVSDCCYHCWGSAIAKHDQDTTKRIIKSILSELEDEPRERIISELCN